MSDELGPVVILDGEEARLILHVVDTFERLLRHGDLDERQLDLLTADGTGAPDVDADLLLADVVGEASLARRRQLDEG